MKTRYLIPAALLVSGALMPVSAFAQAPARGTLATATRIVQAIQAQGSLDKMFGQLVPVLSANAISQLEKLPNAPPRLKAMLADPMLRKRAQVIVSEEVLKSYRARYPALQAAVAREYAATFSEADLRVVLAFYQSPVGKRLLAAQPRLQATLGLEGQKIGQGAGQEALPRALQRIQGLR